MFFNDFLKFQKNGINKWKKGASIDMRQFQILYLFWIMHPTTYLDGYVIQKRNTTRYPIRRHYRYVLLIRFTRSMALFCIISATMITNRHSDFSWGDKWDNNDFMVWFRYSVLLLDTVGIPNTIRGWSFLWIVEFKCTLKP